MFEGMTWKQIAVIIIIATLTSPLWIPGAILVAFPLWAIRKIVERTQ